MHVYFFTTPKFGVIEIEGTRKDAEMIRRRYPGSGKIEARALYRHCERCDSRPCVCDHKDKS